MTTLSKVKQQSNIPKNTKNQGSMESLKDINSLSVIKPNTWKSKIYSKIDFFGHTACLTWEILVSWPRIKPVPPSVEAQRLNHRTVRNISTQKYLKYFFIFKIFFWGKSVSYRNKVKKKYKQKTQRHKSKIIEN